MNVLYIAKSTEQKNLKPSPYRLSNLLSNQFNIQYFFERFLQVSVFQPGLLIIFYLIWLWNKDIFNT
jgi:hypothetical protein